MSGKSKKFIRRIISHIGIIFLALAGFIIYNQLKEYSLNEVILQITSIPWQHVMIACFTCVCGYVVLSVYDFFALRYIGKKLPWWKWMLAGSLGFAISNNAGNAAISGGAIRYRLYTRWRIRGGEIVKMLAFSGFTYFLGAASVVILGYFLVPSDEFVHSAFMHSLFVGCLAFWLAYVSLCFSFGGKVVKFGKLHFHMPRGRMALTQSLLGATDSILAGLVLYFLSMHIANISAIDFIAVFVVAQSAGIFSQVPGGVGVFEGVVMLAMPANVDKAALFGSLLAFRVIYFLLPLAGIGTWFIIYERKLRAEMKTWKIFSHAKKNRKK